jgi:hypothetical protein
MELAENLYIGKDGKLTSDFLGEEAEIVGIKPTPFGMAWDVIIKKD